MANRRREQAQSDSVYDPPNHTDTMHVLHTASILQHPSSLTLLPHTEYDHYIHHCSVRAHTYIHKQQPHHYRAGYSASPRPSLYLHAQLTIHTTREAGAQYSTYIASFLRQHRHDTATQQQLRDTKADIDYYSSSATSHCKTSRCCGGQTERAVYFSAFSAAGGRVSLAQMPFALAPVLLVEPLPAAGLLERASPSVRVSRVRDLPVLVLHSPAAGTSRGCLEAAATAAAAGLAGAAVPLRRRSPFCAPVVAALVGL